MTGLLQPTVGQPAGLGILKLIKAAKGLDKEKLRGLLAGQSEPDPMAAAYQNIDQFRNQLAQDRAQYDPMMHQMMDQRLNAVGDIQASQDRLGYFQGIGNRYSGQGAPNPGDWMPSPDGGRLVWSDKGMWVEQ